MWSSRSIATSDEEFKYDGISSSAASTREFMKHTSIDPCTGVPKNCKYTELKLYFTVYIKLCLCCLLCDSHEYPVFTAIQSFMMIAQDWLDTCYTI